MEYIIYFLFFVAGAAAVFFFFRSRLLVTYGTTKNEHSLDLITEHSDSNTSSNQVNDNSNLEKTEKELNNLHIVNELSQKVTSSLSLEESFRHMYTAINSMMDAAVLELEVRYGDDKDSLIFTNLNEPYESSDHKNHVSSWVFENKREIFLQDAANDYGRYVFEPMVLPNGHTAQSIMSFPITDGKGVIAILSVISFTKNSFEEFHQEMISHLLPFIAVAIKNAYHHEELLVLKQRAERSEKFMQQFLANMSHEIRTPINAVMGMTQLLLDKNPHANQLKYLNSIRNASETLLVIINDILDLSKIEAKKLEIDHIDFSLLQVIRNTDDIMRFKAEKKGLNFIIETDQNIAPILKGDPVRLTQILINLLGNAIKFTETGYVKLTVNLVNPEKFHSLQINKIRFSISDTGIGISKDQQAVLFQDYAQASSEITRKYGGTGLGLSISNQLVLLQGGSIEVNSQEGEGSTFHFTIDYPISENQSMSDRKATSEKEILEVLDGRRILITDDNEYNRIVVKETLELKVKNINVDEANSGLKALKLIEKNSYDLILMDLVMKEMDGYETTHRIRNEIIESKRNIPIVALTASAVKQEHDKCIASGMNGFISKPFKSTDLLKVIHDTLIGMKPVFQKQETKLENTSGKLIDVEYLKTYMDNDSERIKRYLNQIRTKLPDHIEQLHQHIRNNQFDEAHISAHGIKPLMIVAGIQPGIEIAEEIERCCKTEHDHNKLTQLTHRLTEICYLVSEEISELDTEAFKEP